MPEIGPKSNSNHTHKNQKLAGGLEKIHAFRLRVGVGPEQMYYGTGFTTGDGPVCGLKAAFAPKENSSKQDGFARVG
jgi:hypothetical protein